MPAPFLRRASSVLQCCSRAVLQSCQWRLDGASNMNLLEWVNRPVVCIEEPIKYSLTATNEDIYVLRYSPEHT
eukprot:7022913-Pyramimonas_sp.AAC.1